MADLTRDEQILVQLTELSAAQAQAIKQLDRICEAIDGNGKDGLLVRMDRQEQAQEHAEDERKQQRKETFSFKLAAVAAVLAFIGQFLFDIIKG